MKKLKRDRRGRFSLKSWFRRQLQTAVAFLQLVLRIAVFAGGGIAVAALVWGIYFTKSPVTHADAMPAVATSTPVLERIADCESGNGKAGTGTQFDKDGQLIMHVNMSGNMPAPSMSGNMGSTRSSGERRPASSGSTWLLRKGTPKWHTGCSSIMERSRGHTPAGIAGGNTPVANMLYCLNEQPQNRPYDLVRLLWF